MSYRETYENLCVLLEEYEGAEVESIAEQILAMIGLDGEELLEKLDPPPGLQHWLISHGLSLVCVVETKSPRVWEATQEDQEEDDEAEIDLEEEPSLQVGDLAEYRTAARGPQKMSQIGSGTVIEIGEDFLWVRPFGGPDVYLVPGEGDVVRLCRPSVAPPE
jgi:hypothetical protein